MNIMIDARMAGIRVGMGVYERGLLKNLIKIDQKNNYFVVLPKQQYANIPAFLSCSNIRSFYTCISYRNYVTRDMWEQIYVPLLLYKTKIDVYHGPNYTLPVFTKVKKVLTIYDMISFLRPDWYKPISRFRVQNLIKISARVANKIITGSENSKRDIIKTLNVPEEKIKVIYIGIDEAYKPIDNEYKLNFVKNRYNITDNFILYVGSLNPRKNIVRLIDAYSKLPARLRAEYQLVIAGRKNRKSNEIFVKVKRLGLEKRVIFTGFIAENDLPFLMNAADLLVFPSLYEGFGIPPLEAMACGTPVVASNTSSIPEVVGDAALLFNPYNVEDMAESIYKVLVNENLQRKLIIKGFERVKQFSWERAAKETLAVYEEVFYK